MSRGIEASAIISAEGFNAREDASVQPITRVQSGLVLTHRRAQVAY